MTLLGLASNLQAYHAGIVSHCSHLLRVASGATCINTMKPSEERLAHSDPRIWLSTGNS
jgi:hypothetical protein